MDLLIYNARQRGGIIQYRKATEASEVASPWEINITSVDQPPPPPQKKNH